MISVQLEEVHVWHFEGVLSPCEHKFFIHAILRPKTEDDWVKSLILLWLDITCSQKPVLLNCDCTLRRVFGHRYDRIPNVFGPNIHDSIDIFSACFAQSSPQVTSHSISKSMLLDISPHTIDKGILAQVFRDHSQYCTSLSVADHIENLVDVLRPLHRYFNWMTAAETVQRECAL